MRRHWLIVAVILGLPALVAGFVQSQARPEKEAPPAEKKAPKEEARPKPAEELSPDEAAIRANIDRFVKAYNAGDAKAVAALFTTDGQIVGKDGAEAKGRKDIARVFAGLFEDRPGRKIEVFVDSIRFLGKDLALETGSTKETAVPSEPPEYDRYTVLHVKRDGKWQMALARDEEGPEASARERLRPLGWLVGDWVDDGGSTVVLSSCRWSKDGNFLLQNFKIKVEGKDALDVSQRIGWDAAAKRIRSWVFDSEGGFGESVWSRDGDGWIIRANFVRPDGLTASATNLLLPTGKDGYVWRSTDRIVGDERQPATQVRVVRRPPQAKE